MEDSPRDDLPAPVASDDNKVLTAQEEEFCNLFVRGGAEYAGQQVKCYREIFGDNSRNIYAASHRFASDSRIQARIKEMTASPQFEAETAAVKLQIAETLKAVMEETANREYTDRFGIPLSPAPLRAVAVNAAKALMDIFPIKHATETHMKIENGQGGVIFNVIVPQPLSRNNDDEIT